VYLRTRTSVSQALIVILIILSPWLQYRDATIMHEIPHTPGTDKPCSHNVAYSLCFVLLAFVIVIKFMASWWLVYFLLSFS